MITKLKHHWIKYLKKYNFYSISYHNVWICIINFFQLSILLNGNVVEELGTVVHASKAINLGRKMVLKLFDMIPRQMFQVIII